MLIFLVRSPHYLCKILIVSHYQLYMQWSVTEYRGFVLVVMVFCAGCMLDILGYNSKLMVHVSQPYSAHVEKTPIMKFYVENFLDLCPNFVYWFNVETKKQPTVCGCCLGSLGDIASHIA